MPRISFLLILATLPIILICFYIYSKDKNKEPIKLLLKLFFFGILSCILVVCITELIYIFIPFMNKNINQMGFIEILFYSFIIVALVEEFCKWLMVYKIGYNNKEFDEVYDIIVYSVFVSLGFAFLENLLYVLLNNSISVGIARGLLSVPGHACDAIFMGYYLSLAKRYRKNNDRQNEKKNINKSIFIPVLLHGIYDFCIFSGQNIFIIIFFVFIINLYIISIKRLKQTANITTKLFYKNNFCPNCGAKIQGNFCSNCGLRQE